MTNTPGASVEAGSVNRVIATGSTFVLGFADMGLLAGDRRTAVLVQDVPISGMLMLLASDGSEVALLSGQTISLDDIAAGRLRYRPAEGETATDLSFAIAPAGATEPDAWAVRTLHLAVQDYDLDNVARKLSSDATIAIRQNSSLITSGSAITWSGEATGAVIDNSGVIKSTGGDTRAMNASGAASTELGVTIINHDGALIESANDAIRINRDFTAGYVKVDNAGTITSTVSGQALDFDAIGSSAAGQVTILNRATGVIRAAAADAIRPGQNASIINEGLIWSDGTDGDKNDGIDFQARAGSVHNKTGGLISGQRHGITTDASIYVINDTGGVIIGRGGSGVGSDGTGKVVNYGTIIGTYTGTNSGDGDGVDIDGYGEVDNYGSISAIGSRGYGADGGINLSDGVALTSGGYLYNHAGALIESTTYSIAAFGGVKITNEGMVRNTIFGDGIILFNAESGTIDAPDEAAFFSPYTYGNQITNKGTITSLKGLIFADGTNVIVNFGLIIAGTNGAPGNAITFGRGNDKLVIAAGSLITGAVDGGDGTDIIELTDGASFSSSTRFEQLLVSGKATITGSNAFATTTLAADAGVMVATGARLEVGQIASEGVATVTVDGTLRIGSGTLEAHLEGNGLIEKTDSGLLTLTQNSAFSGTLRLLSGSLTLADGAGLGAGIIDASPAATTITFARGATASGGTISGLGADDRIVFEGLTAARATLSVNDGHARIVDGQGAAVTFNVANVAAGLSLALRHNDSDGIDLVTTKLHLVRDFNADGYADLLVRNTEKGTFGIVSVDGATIDTSAPSQAPDAGWSAVATLDFNGDKGSDILWRNIDGTFSIWTGLADGTFEKDVYVNATVSGAWRIASTGDFNGDGKDDLLWRHADGTLTQWNSTGSGFVQNVLVSKSMSRDWTITGHGDFNGDGIQDVVWRNGFTGEFTIWQGGTSAFTRNTYTNATVNTAWQIAGVGDFDGDGRDDLMWRLNNGDLAEWRSTDKGFVGNVFNAHGPTGDWRIQGVDDYNHDGLADLLFRNNDTGEVKTWQSDGKGFDQDIASWSLPSDTSLLNGATVATLGRQAYPQRDFNKDGWGDLLWQNDNGTFTTWGMFGASAQKNTYYNNSLDSSWNKAGTLDMNGDGSTDLIFRKTDGTFSIWTREGNGFHQDAYVNNTVSNAWSLVGIGDFNGDGKDDLLWHNQAAGVLTQWRSTGSGYVANATYDAGIPNGLSFMGTGDVDGDGRDELFWRDQTGKVGEWKFTATGLVRDLFTKDMPVDWTLSGIDDIDGDGRDDLIWQHQDGRIQIWHASGSGFDVPAAWQDDAGAAWRIAQVNDFNRDGRADLLLRNMDTGAFATWLKTDHGFDHNVYQDTNVTLDWHLVSSSFGF